MQKFEARKSADTAIMSHRYNDGCALSSLKLTVEIFLSDGKPKEKITDRKNTTQIAVRKISFVKL